jgi:hypothetical protein
MTTTRAASSFATKAAVTAAIALAPAVPAHAGWKTQEIGTSLNVVYALSVADMNRDGKPDIVAINNTQVMWFENPTWTKHVVFDGPQSGHPFWKKDNVCFATEDIDGDGWLDVALGADWQPTNTTGGGSVQWLQRTDRKDPDAPWRLHPISTEPTVHRMRWGDVDGDGKNELVVKALQGRGTKGPDWDGAGARVLVFHKPKDPVGDPWLVEVAANDLHIAHNFFIDKGALWTASKEGVSVIARDRKGTWSRRRLGEGVPGEIRPGRVAGVRRLATIEPWHGTALVLFTDPGGPLGARPWPREVIDPGLTEGHAVAWGDFDRDGDDEIIAGWRKAPFGVAHYRRGADGAWTKTMVDDGGMAAEDAVVADLDGDKVPEVIAGGRATSNIRIYRFVKD